MQKISLVGQKSMTRLLDLSIGDFNKHFPEEFMVSVIGLKSLNTP